MELLKGHRIMASMTGKILQKLRAKHNISQSVLADYLGYKVNGKPNRSMIARFENDHAPINTRISQLLEFYFDGLDKENV